MTTDAALANNPLVVDFEKTVLGMLSDCKIGSNPRISTAAFQNTINSYIARLPSPPRVTSWYQLGGITLTRFFNYLASKGYVIIGGSPSRPSITTILSTTYIPSAVPPAPFVVSPRPPPPSSINSNSIVSAESLQRQMQLLPRFMLPPCATTTKSSPKKGNVIVIQQTKTPSKSNIVTRRQSALNSTTTTTTTTKTQLQKRQHEMIDCIDLDCEPEAKRREKENGEKDQEEEEEEEFENEPDVICPYHGCGLEFKLHKFVEHAMNRHCNDDQIGMICPLDIYDGDSQTVDQEQENLLMHLHDSHPNFIPKKIFRKLSDVVSSAIQREFSDKDMAFAQMSEIIVPPPQIAAGSNAPSASHSRSPNNSLLQPGFRVDTLYKDDMTSECVICFCPFRAGERIARLECLCRFHENCILGWFGKSVEPFCPNHPK